MIEILAFFVVVLLLTLLYFIINYYFFGEAFSLSQEGLMIFLTYDQQNKVKQVNLSVFWAIFNNGLKKIAIKELDLSLSANELHVPFTLASNSPFSEGIAETLPINIDRNVTYNEILSFTIKEPLGEELKQILVTKDGRETLKDGKYDIEIAVKYNSRKIKNFNFKLNLDERMISNLPVIDNNKVILPIKMFQMLWKVNNIRRKPSKTYYRW